MSKSRRMRWALHVAFIQERRNACLDWSEDPEEEGHLEDGADGRITVKFILKNQGGRV
jgi:hypothetical protein